MHAHARNGFRLAQNVNKPVANHACSCIAIMYRVNDLKRLKKVELLEVAAASKLQLVSAKKTKRQITLWVKKNMPPYFCPYLRQILTDFKNSLTGTLCGKFAIKWLLIIPPNLNSIATLPCETLMSAKLAIAAVSSCAQRLFGHFRKFRQKSQQMIRMTLDCVRPVSPDTLTC